MRRRLAVAIVLWSALACPAAWAQAEQGGMPQLNFANPLTTSQVVWLAIIFFALYLLVSRWALPQVTEVIEDRAASIAADLGTARQAKEAADAAAEEENRATQRARAEAQAEISGAIARAKEAAAAQSEQMNARLQAQLDTAEQRIGEARTRAMGALRQVATDTAMVVVNRLTGQPADQRAVEQAVGAALANRPG
ncbi:MAG: F0F1 ATP synthase subunit B [Acidisphaera sp.]|nr:F0F1 ATP synthase subunit B [Acidisphaera sp.]